MDRMGASELLISWPSTRTSRCQACRSSSRSARRRSARTTSTCGFPPRRKLVRLSSNFPAPPGKVSSRVRGAGPSSRGGEPVEHGGEAELASLGRWQPRKLGAEELLGSAVREHRLSALLEGEDSDVDLLHHPAEERAGFERPEPLLPEQIGKLVELEHQLPERVGEPRRPAPHAEVAFPQRRDEVRRRLQGTQHPLAEGKGGEEPAADDHYRDGPPDLRSRVEGDEQTDRGGGAGKTAKEREAEHPRVVRDTGCSGLRAPAVARSPVSAPLEHQIG